MTGGAFEEILSRFFIEQARVDRLIIELAEGEERRQRDAAVAAAERAVDQQREKESRDFVGEGRVRLAAEHRHLRALHGIQKAELRVDHAGMRLTSAELHADGAMQFHEVLNAEIPRAGAVSR